MISVVDFVTMCGFFATNQPNITHGQQLNLDRSLSSRGPDSQSEYSEHRYHSKHYRLITRGNNHNGIQPAITNDYIILFNGNIYNSDQLAREHHIDNSGSDTDVLVSLFQKIGPSVFSLLDGFFAICIYNRKTKSWILARDRLGIKPLFYYDSKSIFCCASRADSVSILSESSISEYQAIMYLKYGCSKLNNTLFEDVYQVKPGSFLLKEFEKPAKSLQYWKPEDYFDNTLTSKESSLLLQETLASGFNDYIDTSRNLAFLFSGGIDSTAIAAVGKSLSKSNSSFYGFTLGSGDDRLLKDAGNYLFGDNYIFNEFDPDLSQLNPLVLDLPFDDTSIYSCFQVFSKVSNFAQVCITGDGADELFGGYSSFSNLSKFESLSPFMKPLLHRVFPSKSNLLSKSPKSLIQLSLDENTLLDSIVSNGFKMWEMSRFLTKDAYLTLQNDLILPEYPVSRLIDKLRYLFLSQKLPNQMFYKVDRASMANGVEARPVLCSNKIVELALKSNLGNRKLYNKPELRSVINFHTDNQLICKLQKRRKSGFGFPGDLIAQAGKQDKEIVADKLSQFINIDNFVNHQAFNKRQNTLVKNLSSFFTC